jgi:hypothetical protein
VVEETAWCGDYDVRLFRVFLLDLVFWGDSGGGGGGGG